MQGLGFWVVGHSDGWMCTALSVLTWVWKPFDQELARVIGYDALLRSRLGRTETDLGPEDKQRYLMLKVVWLPKFLVAILFTPDQQSTFCRRIRYITHLE